MLVQASLGAGGRWSGRRRCGEYNSATGGDQRSGVEGSSKQGPVHRLSRHCSARVFCGVVVLCLLQSRSGPESVEASCVAMLLAKDVVKTGTYYGAR